jgi:hypothetical protein
MSDGGKGSKPRPFSVSQEDYADRFDAIFGKKNNSVDETDDKITRNNEETQEVLNLNKK